MADLALQRLALQSLLSLPSPVLRLMSGGAAVYLGGKTLDPRFQVIAHTAQSRHSDEALAPETFRASITKTMPVMAAKPEPGVAWEAFSLEGPNGLIPCRLYRPAGQDASMPVMVYAHGGGGVIGDLETSHAFCSQIAAATRGPVLSVHYRLAPEYRFPTGLEDVLAAYRYARDNARTFGAPTGVAAIGGDSMGGNFAAVICQMLKAAGEDQPQLQLLLYPCVDMASETASMTTYAQTFPLGNGLMDWFLSQYIGSGDAPADPRLSPIKARDLSGLAPAIIVTAGFDPLLDQGRDYAQRLKAAGVEVAYRTHDSLIHGFMEFAGLVPAADAACRETAALVRDMIQAPSIG